MNYIAYVNTPGYVPDSDSEPDIYATPADAWWSLYHERCYAESEQECDLCYGESTHGISGNCDDDSETGRALGEAARAGLIGTVYGPTPGYRGDHDLGLAYTVDIAEES